MKPVLRRFLFSRQYFAVLLVVLALDMTADLADLINPGHHGALNGIAIGFDFIEIALGLWMFLDLSRRRPRDGDHSSRR